MQSKGRAIFHVDMNSFYASVEMAFDPSLRGKPLAICGNPAERKGIVVTSSYEARKKGVRTTMPLWEARRLCPDLLVMRPNFDRYRKASSEMFKLLQEVTPMIQPVSIDEGYMDVTDCSHLGSTLEIAQTLQERILKELDLPCSIGIAPNKFLAKMASDMKKPLGITVLRKRDISSILWPLPIEEMYGVGAKTAEKMRTLGIQTIGELAHKDKYQLKRIFGVNGERLSNRANGIDDRPVDPEAVHSFKSIGSSQTLPHDTTDDKELDKLLSQLSKSVEKRMHRKEAIAKGIQLMIRYHDRKTITRSMKLHHFLESADEVFQHAQTLLLKHWNGEPIRLLGVSVFDVAEKKEVGKQLNLFTYEKEAEKEGLYKAIDDLTSKFGKNPFRRVQANSDDEVRTSFQKDFLDDFKK
ncbi:DNA polymerase IV [Terribacillus sp. DMT04]|uniref:DNA polymerase IV n=1 Tax=Terribacillus sp. DMT04 TaxID=2850441 RepID=UPI001C2C42DD|nr:DNA polymerase IV [Terribacillus sp. DMT04]QXE00347.1 DNA polymerase IV [Terribacillus sp. DMT04]